MGFCIDRHAPPRDELRRILLDQLDRAILELGRTSPDLRSKAVHSARRRVKKIRAILRLIRFCGDRRFSKVDHHFLRDSARSLAPLRNSDANRKTAGKLSQRAGDPGQIAGVLRMLNREKSLAGVNAAASMQGAAMLLKNARMELDSWHDGSIEWEDFYDALKHLYKRARKAFEKAVKENSGAVLHQCRKRTKDLLHALLLLRAIHPKSTRKYVDTVGKLGSLLGKHHDLTQLGHTLETAGIKPKPDAIRELASARIRKLRNRIMKLGAKLYSEKPGAFITTFTE